MTPTPSASAPSAPVPAATPGSVSDVVAATPDSRDRWVDALRVGSLLVVVLGHWLMGALTPQGQVTNVLAQVPALQPVTWLLQVMPLFFLVGGVAHAHALASAERVPGTSRGRYAAFVRGRSGRLLRPTAAFLVVWVVLAVLAHVSGLASGPSGDLVAAVLSLSTQLLWFVGIYLGVAALAPATHAWHRRSPAGAVLTLVVGAVVVDVVRFATGETLVGTLNFALVWLALHQLGYCWKDGLLTRRIAVAMVAVGLVGLRRGRHGRAVPGEHGRGPRRGDLQHGAAHRRAAAPGHRDLRRGGAAARPDDDGARASTGLAGRRARGRDGDDGVPLAPHRADAGDARHPAGGVRPPGARHLDVVADPTRCGSPCSWCRRSSW